MANKNGLKLPLSNGKTFATRSHNQAEYARNIITSFISFCLGAAGTGKTYISVATALHLLHEKQIKKIILTRPAVEAGEELGFLPGTLEEKLAPFLFPLFDSIDDLIGKQERERMIEKGQLEIVPLAYMRGRSIPDSIILIDEAQNATKSQMKMLLTRIGKNSRIIVNGDESQVDLTPKSNSGFIDAVNRLKGKQGVSVIHFQTKDMMRHPIVKTVIDAYNN